MNEISHQQLRQAVEDQHGRKATLTQALVAETMRAVKDIVGFVRR